MLQFIIVRSSIYAGYTFIYERAFMINMNEKEQFAQSNKTVTITAELRF